MASPLIKAPRATTGASSSHLAAQAARHNTGLAGLVKGIAGIAGISVKAGGVDKLPATEPATNGPCGVRRR